MHSGPISITHSVFHVLPYRVQDVFSRTLAERNVVGFLSRYAGSFGVGHKTLLLIIQYGLYALEKSSILMGEKL